MAAPQFDAVVDGIVATLQASAGLSAAGVRVLDGPVPSDEATLAFVTVGWDGDDESSAPVIRTVADWHDMGGPTSSSRDESIEVDCYMVVQSGNDSFSTLRTSAATYLGYVSDALRALPALGVANVLWADVTSVDVVQGVSTEGAFVEVPFGVRVRTLI